MRAVIDRFEGETAVILVGDNDSRIHLPRKLLPKGSKEGDWLNLLIEPDPAGTTRQREKIAGILNRLKAKNP